MKGKIVGAAVAGDVRRWADDRCSRPLNVRMVQLLTSTWVLYAMTEMRSLPRTFVSFSSADKGRYDLMCAWKAHEHINFNFADFQLDEAINSVRPHYIKSVCAAKIRRVDTFVLLIGNDTYTKTVFVKDEVETAVEKGCRLIGVNLNNCRFKDALCPAFFADVGALFVPFSSRVLAEALTWDRQGTSPWYYFFDEVYTRLGYQLIGDNAVLPKPLNPFSGGNRPPWAR